MESSRAVLVKEMNKCFRHDPNYVELNKVRSRAVEVN